MTKPRKPPKDQSNNFFFIETKKAQIIIAVFILVGFLSSILYSSQAASLAQFMSIAVTILAIAGAALMAGGLLGFLFGIPKRLQQDSVNASNQSIDNSKQDNGRNVIYQENTNLEQISDWLTKILVGVGLTQLTTIPEALKNYASFTASGLGNFASSQDFAIALLLYFLICGFLIVYLWTRLYLAGAFRQAEQEAMGGIAKKFSELEEQMENNAKALTLVQSQLKPTPNSQPVEQEQLTEAVKFASDAIRDQIYQQVGGVFTGNFEAPNRKSEVESTIPVLQALVAYDTNNYLYHAMLGFAMKVLKKGNWQEAETEFTTAIGLKTSKDYDLWVETNRAEIRINNDPDFLQGKKSSEEFRNNILDDLKAPVPDPELMNYDKINRWLKLNNIKLSDLISNT